MGFGEAYINIQLLTQAFLDSPIIYDKLADRVTTNPKIVNKLRMYRWYIGNYFIASVHLFSAVHLGQLLKNFDLQESSKAKKEEVFVYIFTVAITAEALLTWITAEKHLGWIAGVEAQIFRAFAIKHRKWPGKARSPDIFEVMAYGMALGFFLFPLSTIVLPIIRSYDPINQMVETFVPISLHPKAQKAIVILAYLWSVSFGALSCLNMLLLTLTHCYVLSMIAKQNYTVSKSFLANCSSIKFSKSRDSLVNINNILTFTETRNLKRVFQKRFLLYQQFRFMISGINIGLGWYIPASLGVGMSLCITSNYGLIDLYGRLPKIMEASMVITTLGFSILILHLLLYAAIPLTYSEMFKHFWRKVKMGNLERKQLKAMIPAGFAMGSYFNIKKRSALDVFDSMLNYTVSVLMG